MSGHVGDLSPQQEATLEEFKTILEDIPNKPDDTDHYYLRWLRARKFDIRKSELMFRNHMEYRKKYGAETILHDYTPPEVFTECLAGGFFGEDLDGHPVWYDNLGNLDPRGLHRSMTNIDEILKYKCLHSEQLDLKCKEFSEKKRKHIETLTIVADFRNLSFQKHYYWPGVEILKEILAEEEANNPERIKTVLLINAPKIFPFCYNVVKHVLDEKTRRKVVVIGINRDLKEELQKYISLDELPAIYGGNRMEPDEECSDFISHGKDVPPKYYLTNQTETSKEQMDRVMVGRGSVHKANYVIEDAGSTLQWEFFSTDYDIAFGVYVKRRIADKKEKTVIHALSRHESHLYPQTGHHTCQLPGEYVLKFDNSYSWTRPKEIFFSIKVLPPNVQPEESPAAGISRTPDDPSSRAEDEDKFYECDDQVDGQTVAT